MTTTSSGYSTSGGVNPSGAGIASAVSDDEEYWSLQKCKQAYQDYLGNKREEINEQKDARRYRHGAQWTEDQIKVLNRRKQPVVTYNRIGRKIDGIVGLVERLRQDPKAFPRTPQHQQGADLATAVLRYALDTNDWKAKSPIVAECGAVDGIGGIELELELGDHTAGQQADMDVGFKVFQPDGFFYDPRSFELDFSDAQYLGLGKWVDLDIAKQMGMDVSEGAGGYGLDLTSNSDRDNKWFFSTGRRQMVRLVDIWYQHKGQWCWCLFTGAAKIKEGISPYRDEKDQTFAKYIAYSAAVDHDGDRYGFPRNLRSAQDEINQRRSKGLHELNSRRIRAPKGSLDNIERARQEAARPDGILEYNPMGQAVPEFDDAAKQVNLMGQLEFLKEAKAEIENFGPNPAVLGDSGIKNQSGRAIALLQQAGIAELGPYMLAYRGWKLRVYRALFNTIQRYWTSERWIRVTDEKGLAQFIPINQVGVGPDGMPTIVNAIGSLDVDIILDEGPDQVNLMADTYETISNALPAVAGLISGPVAQAALQVLIETSPLPESAKKQFRDAAAQPAPPSPEAQKMQMEMQRDQAKGQMEMQKAQGELQLKQTNAALDAQIEREKAQNAIHIAQTSAAADIQIAREKAANDLMISREKANHDMEVEAHVAAHRIKIERDAAKNRPAE